jgi:DNA-damage-inducible protein J
MFLIWGIKQLIIIEVGKMIKSETIRARVEPDLKREVEQIFKTLGLSATEAISLFYNMVKLKKGIPFDVKIPNQETQKVIRDSRKGIDVTTQGSLDDYFKKIEMEMGKEMDA